MAFTAWVTSNKDLIEALSAIANVFIGVAAAFVAVASFYISKLTFKRDAGQLDVSLSVGEIYDEASGKKGPHTLRIEVVNSGRRPLVLRSLGGKRSVWVQLVEKLRGKDGLSHSYLSGAEIRRMIFDGPKSRTLHEGEMTDALIMITTEKELAGLTKTFCELSTFFAIDSLGKTHTMKKKVLKRLKRDLRTTKL